MRELHLHPLSDDAFPKAMLATLVCSAGALIYWVGELLLLVSR